MIRAKSGYYYNSKYNKINDEKRKKKEIKKSISENFIISQNKDIKNNSKNNSKNIEDYKINNINIKFNILNNYKKYYTIFNNSIYPKILNNNQENKTSRKFRMKLINNKPYKPKIKINYDYYNNNSPYENDFKGQVQLEPLGYFPEDFSLNIYKCTSFYKNRYKIQSCRLKKTLKNIYVNENSKKNKDINTVLKKKLNENILTKEMLKLLKSNQIDRFVNRLLNLKNCYKNQNENRKDNNSLSNRQRKKFISHDKKVAKKGKLFCPNTDYRKLNICINSYTNNYVNRKRNYLVDNIKTNISNTDNQNININKNKNKYFVYNLNEFEDKPLTDKNTRNILNENKYINSTSSSNYEKNKGNYYNYDNSKEKFIKKIKRPFSSSNAKTSFSNTKNKITKNSSKKKGLIFSFYDPNDKYIKIFERLEKKAKDSDGNNSNI